MPNLLPSITRTVVPVIVGWLIALALRAGFDFGDQSDELTSIFTVIVTGVYYTVVRLLETHGSAQFGWLLGLANPPAYSATKADTYADGDLY